jgi:subtilisin family serine protease
MFEQWTNRGAPRRRWLMWTALALAAASLVREPGLLRAWWGRGLPGPAELGMVAVMRDEASVHQLRVRLPRCELDVQPDGRTVVMEQRQWSTAVGCAMALWVAPGVSSVERNRTVTVAGWWRPSTDVPAPGWHWEHVQLAQALRWSTGQGVTIAVVDSGVDSAHPDLQGLLLPGIHALDAGAPTDDERGHGTAVAGVAVAAFAQEARRAQVRDRARILPVKVTQGQQPVTLGQIARGIQLAAEAGAQVVNASYEGLTESPTIRAAAQHLRRRGGVLVVPAGNRGLNPGWSRSPWMVAVGATDEHDQRPAWASYGWHLSMAAPGANIATLRPGGGHVRVSGSSYAAPMVAGVLALMMALDPKASPEELERLLLDSSQDLGRPGPDEEFGHGRLDAGAAVEAVRRGARRPS